MGNRGWEGKREKGNGGWEVGVEVEEKGRRKGRWEWRGREGGRKRKERVEVEEKGRRGREVGVEGKRRWKEKEGGSGGKS